MRPVNSGPCMPQALVSSKELIPTYILAIDSKILSLEPLLFCLFSVSDDLHRVLTHRMSTARNPGRYRAILFEIRQYFTDFDNFFIVLLFHLASFFIPCGHRFISTLDIFSKCRQILQVGFNTLVCTIRTANLQYRRGYCKFTFLYNSN